jgi:anaerobic magnesium-protoporphyrin IX monomethyl ester cyclase
LRMMKQAGCMRIRFGNESGSNEILTRLKKWISTDQIRCAFDMSRSEKLSTVSYFIIGLPSETKKQIWKTLELAKELNAGFTNFSILTLYPGTELYDIALEKGVIKRDCWRDFSRNPRSDFQPPLWEENFSRAELINLQKKIYRRYYLRPGFIIKKLFEISTWKGLRETVVNALKLLGLKKK